MRNFSLILLIAGFQAVSGQENKDPLVFENETTKIKIGGFVQGQMASDFNGAINNHDFVVSSLRVPENWQHQNRLAFDGSVSRISLSATHKTNKIGDIKLFIETDFRSTGNAAGLNLLRLRHAYVSVLGFTAGQTWTFMYDSDAMAPTIDVPGVNSRSFHRTPLIGYTYQFGKKFSAGVSFEMPEARITASSITQDGTTRNILVASDYQTIPDIPAFVQFKSSKFHVKLAGVFRNINYAHNLDINTLEGIEKIKRKQGYGGQISCSIKPVSAFTIYANGIYGKGIARYINDLRTGSFDLLYELTSPDNIDAPTMYSYSVGIRADISKKVYLSTNFSIAELEKNKKFIDDTDNLTSRYYKHGKYFSGTIWWKVYGNLLFATEYLYGYRENMNSDSGKANRLQAMIRYNF